MEFKTSFILFIRCRHHQLYIYKKTNQYNSNFRNDKCNKAAPKTKDRDDQIFVIFHMSEEKFEDTKGVTRIRKTKDGQYNG